MGTGRGSLTALVLAAGQGKRLRSKTIKLLHAVAGRAMVSHVIEAVRALRPSALIAVVGHQGERVRAELGGRVSGIVVQREQRGTGHAVVQAATKIRRTGSSLLLIINGDLPTLRTATLRKLVARHRRSGAALTLLTGEPDDPSGYGRIVRDSRGRVCRIVEHGDATTAERKIREINCGIYCAEPVELMRVLRRLRPENEQGEYYITDAVRALIEAGEPVLAVPHDDAEEILGVNTRQELARASAVLYRRKAEQVQDRGVTLLDAGRTWIDPRARIGRDTVVYPGVLIEGSTRVGQACVVRQGCRLADSNIGDRVEIRDYSVVLNSRIGHDAQVGPFAHLRPGSNLEAESRVGNFVEIKKTRLGRRSKANHLAYLGDAKIGSDCNIGAGTITCNYDGERKHPSLLGNGVFVGSDTQLVAPVRLEDGAYVAAGTTVTENVPAGALAVGRARQRNIAGWTSRRARKKGAAKKGRGD